MMEAEAAPNPDDEEMCIRDRKYPGEQRLHLYAQPGGRRPEDTGGAAEHFIGAACLCDQFRAGSRAAVLQ